MSRETKNNGHREGDICEQFTYFPKLALYTNSSYINEIYRNSLRSFLYIGAAGFALDILRSLCELRISAGLRFRYAAPKECATRHLRKPAAPLGDILLGDLFGPGRKNKIGG